MKLKNQILAHKPPLRADEVKHVFHASLLIHHVKVFERRLLYINRIHIFTQRGNTLNRNVQLVCTVDRFIKRGRQ
ncbi:Uncharacterised protein [Salmonella enterica subsp. enterica serovar Derby]|nr:Uncharacterised protein [Salmonella enterica subsp. enterica serovar Derby]